jgi:hypothetical protein
MIYKTLHRKLIYESHGMSRISAGVYVICILRRLVSNTLMFASFNSNVSGHTSGTGTEYTSGTPALILDIPWDS